MTERPDDRTVRFGGFRLNLGLGELERDGEIVALRPKAMAVLVAMVREAGSLVPRDRLLAAGWGDSHVDEEAALHGVVREIRQALGDTATEPEFIATVHRRGYRFVAEIESTGETGQDALETSSERRLERPGVMSWRVGGVAVAAAGVVVVAAVLWFGRQPESSVQPARAASIVNAPNDVLRARYLIDTGDHEDLGRGADILRAAVETGGGELAWAGLAVAELRLGNDDPARAAARRALELDPDSAAAYRVLGQLAVIEGDMDSAEASILRALELDGASGLSQHALAFYLAANGELEEAVRVAEIARSLTPGRGVAGANLSRFLLYQRDYTRAMQIAADSSAVENKPALQLLCLETRQAAAWLHGDFESSRGALVVYIEHLGAEPEALAAFLAAPAREGAESALRWRLGYHARLTEDAPSYHVEAALVHAQLGELDAAARELAKLQRFERLSQPTWMNDPRMDPMRDRPEFLALEERYRERLRS